MVDGGEGSVDALSVGDFGIGLFVEGDVEIHANENAFAGDSDVVQGKFIHIDEWIRRREKRLFDSVESCLGQCRIGE